MIINHATLFGELEGAIDSSGNVMGTYIHGLFHNGGVRSGMLNELARRKCVSLPDLSSGLDLDLEYDKLADWVRSSMDMSLIYRLAGLDRDYDSVRL